MFSPVFPRWNEKLFLSETTCIKIETGVGNLKCNHPPIARKDKKITVNVFLEIKMKTPLMKQSFYKILLCSILRWTIFSEPNFVWSKLRWEFNIGESDAALVMRPLTAPTTHCQI